MPYVSSQHTTVSKPIGISGNPVDARSVFYDATLFKYRDYVSTAEVLSYLPTAANRRGRFLIFVNTGGTLSNGVITGGTTSVWWFKEGVADGDLVEFSTGGSSIPVDATPTSGSPNAVQSGGTFTELGKKLDKTANLSDLSNAATARTNLGLGTLATQSGTFSGTSSGTNTGDQDLSGLMVKANNLSDLTNPTTARSSLGLGTLATQSGDFAALSTTVGNKANQSDLDALELEVADKVSKTNSAVSLPLADTDKATIKRVVNGVEQFFEFSLLQLKGYLNQVSADIGTTKVWWDITDSSNLIIDNTESYASIAQITDKSGSGINATQSVKANQARYFSSGGMNNKGYARFDGNPMGYSSDTVQLGSVYSLYIVYKANSTGLSSILGSSPSAYMGYDGARFAINNGDSKDTLNLVPGNWVILSIHRNGASKTVRENGVITAFYDNVIDDETFNFQGISNIAGYSFNGSICEVFAKDNVENTAQRSTTEEYLFSKYAVGSRLFILADSWGYGTGLSPLTNRFGVLLAAEMGMTEVNRSINGTVVQNTAPTEPYNFRDRYATSIPSPTTANDLAIIMGGVNDACRDNPDYNATNLENDLNEIVTGLIAKGWISSNIILCTQGKISNDSGVDPNDRNDPAVQVSFNTAIQNVATAKATKFVDVYAAMAPNGVTAGSSYSIGDGLHTNNTGHALIKDLILAVAA